MNISPEWLNAIDLYIAHMRAAGAPLTSQNTRRQHLQHMARRIGIGPWEVTGERLVEWAGDQVWALSTRHGRRASFREFWRWAKQRKLTRHNPAKALPKVRQPKARPRPCPDRIYKEALMRADARTAIALRLANDNGLRRGEIAVVHNNDIFEDLVGHSLLVHGKGNKTRDMPLSPAIARMLLDLPQGWAFPGDDGGHLSPRWLGKIVNRTLEGGWTIHSLRHRFASRVRRLFDLDVAQELLGHASADTTRIYAVVPREELREAVLAVAS